MRISRKKIYATRGKNTPNSSKIVHVLRRYTLTVDDVVRIIRKNIPLTFELKHKKIDIPFGSH